MPIAGMCKPKQTECWPIGIEQAISQHYVSYETPDATMVLCAVHPGVITVPTGQSR